MTGLLIVWLVGGPVLSLILGSAIHFGMEGREQ